MVDMSRFSQDIARIQADQIGLNIAPTPSQRKLEQSQFAQEFKAKLGISDDQDIVQFSNHAIARLQKRNIDITPTDLSRITSAIDKAAAKGSRDSLVMIDDLALVVSIKNRTVITAMDQQSMKDQVITNIDSAVIG